MGSEQVVSKSNESFEVLLVRPSSFSTRLEFSSSETDVWVLFVRFVVLKTPGKRSVSEDFQASKEDSRERGF